MAYRPTRGHGNSGGNMRNMIGFVRALSAVSALALPLSAPALADVVVNNVLSPGSITVVGPGSRYVGPDYYDGSYYREPSYYPRRLYRTDYYDGPSYREPAYDQRYQ